MSRRARDGDRVSLSDAFAAGSSASLGEERTGSESLRSPPWPSVFVRCDDAAGRLALLGVLDESRAGSSSVVTGATSRTGVVARQRVAFAATSPPVDSVVARRLVLFTSQLTFDTIPAPSSDAILVP